MKQEEIAEVIAKTIEWAGRKAAIAVLFGVTRSDNVITVETIDGTRARITVDVP